MNNEQRVSVLKGLLERIRQRSNGGHPGLVVDEPAVRIPVLITTAPVAAVVAEASSLVEAAPARAERFALPLEVLGERDVVHEPLPPPRAPMESLGEIAIEVAYTDSDADEFAEVTAAGEGVAQPGDGEDAGEGEESAPISSRRPRSDRPLDLAEPIAATGGTEGISSLPPAESGPHLVAPAIAEPPSASPSSIPAASVPPPTGEEIEIEIDEDEMTSGGGPSPSSEAPPVDPTVPTAAPATHGSALETWRDEPLSSNDAPSPPAVELELPADRISAIQPTPEHASEGPLESIAERPAAEDVPAPPQSLAPVEDGVSAPPEAVHPLTISEQVEPVAAVQPEPITIAETPAPVEPAAATTSLVEPSAAETAAPVEPSAAEGASGVIESPREPISAVEPASHRLAAASGAPGEPELRWGSEHPSAVQSIAPPPAAEPSRDSHPSVPDLAQQLEATPTESVDAALAPVPEVTKLIPEVTKQPARATGVEIGLVGAAGFAPASFGELLDASLELGLAR